MNLERYEIIQELNRGPISTVYLGRQTTLDRLVLIKRLNDKWQNEADLSERFRREAIICARLKHRNIVNIIDVSTSPDNLYLVSEYVEGLDLEKFIAQYHPVPFDILLYITREILNGLAYAHDKGVIHRDIKPSNIMISRDGAVKIADFGLARAEDLPAISMHGEVVGTAAYMSPEQARVSQLDRRTDLFSLGVTIYELAGQPSPFRGENIVASLQKLTTYSPPPLCQFREDMPIWFSDFVARMLAKKPQNRPDSAKQILELPEFKNLAGNHQALIRFMGDPGTYKIREPQGPTPAVKRKDLKVTLLLSALAAVVVLMVLFVFTNWSGRERATPIERNTAVFPIDDSTAIAAKADRESEVIAVEPPRQQEVREQPVAENSGDAQKPELLPGTPAVINRSEELEKSTSIAEAGEEDIGSEMDAEGQTTRLFVSCSPWADIYINGEKQQTTPLQQAIPLSAGRYLLELKNPQFEVYREEIFLRLGQSDTITVNLRSLAGYLNLQVSPWAKVYIDGEYIDTTPLKRPLVLPPGKHQLRLSNSKYHVWQDSIVIIERKTLSKQIFLEKK